MLQIFDHNVKTKIVLTKSTLDQGSEPATSCQELAIESVEEPGDRW